MSSYLARRPRGASQTLENVFIAEVRPPGGRTDLHRESGCSALRGPTTPGHCGVPRRSPWGGLGSASLGGDASRTIWGQWEAQAEVWAQLAWLSEAPTPSGSLLTRTEPWLPPRLSPSTNFPGRTRSVTNSALNPSIHEAPAASAQGCKSG